MIVKRLEGDQPIVAFHFTAREVEEILRFLKDQKWTRADSIVVSDFFSELNILSRK